MTRRQAKKVRRGLEFRFSTYHRADMVLQRVWWRTRGVTPWTPGWRWGRWDPTLPIPPAEMPF